MAPYSCGGDLKFAATSRSDGTETCCQGRGPSNAAARREKRSSLIAAFIPTPRGPKSAFSPTVYSPAQRRETFLVWYSIFRWKFHSWYRQRPLFAAASFLS